MKECHPDDRIQQSEQQRELNIERNQPAQQPARQHPIKKLVEEIKEENQYEADHGMFDIDTHAHRRREIADQRLHDSVHPQWLLDR